MDFLFNVIGLIGVGFLLFAYFMLQTKKFSDQDIRYWYANLAGAFFVIISLYWSWNLAAFVLEIAWAAISARAILKISKDKGNAV